MSSPSSRRDNNFDLIRLLAAAQVVAAHAIGHTPLAEKLSPVGQRLFDILLMIPGVPIFFVISGFLILRSFEKNPADVKGYLWRRGLRIFPALWVCLAVTIGALGAFGFLGADFVFSGTFAAWIAGQMSFVQFFNPEQFRGFGIGVANGALWTITVELQFYLFVPIYHFLTRPRPGGRAGVAITAVLFLVSFGAFCVMDDKVNGPGGYGAAPTVYKLLFVSLVPHLWMFLLGATIHRHFDRIRGWFEGRFLVWAALYAVALAAVHFLLPWRSLPWYLSYLPTRVILAGVTISAAYSARWLSRKILRGNDISYGSYLYHSVVINVLVESDRMESFVSVAAVYGFTLALAVLSWRFVEKPALAMKPKVPGSEPGPVEAAVAD
ncbi:MAG: acyltransferase [Akkermansiaceae bacterium]|nr:acyltransferase [Akkermansiaceae bacterium]